jgi:hypothetical protein
MWCDSTGIWLCNVPSKHADCVEWCTHDIGQGTSEGAVFRRSGLVQNVGKVGTSHVKHWDVSWRPAEATMFMVVGAAELVGQMLERCTWQ